MDMKILPDVLAHRRSFSVLDSKPQKFGGAFQINLNQNKGPFADIQLAKYKSTSKVVFNTKSTSFRSTKRSSLSSDRYNKEKQKYQQKQLSYKRVTISELIEEHIQNNSSSSWIVRNQIKNQVKKTNVMLAQVKQDVNKIKHQIQQMKKQIGEQMDKVLRSGLVSIKVLKQLLLQNSSLSQNLIIGNSRQIKQIKDGFRVLSSQMGDNKTTTQNIELQYFGGKN